MTTTTTDGIAPTAFEQSDGLADWRVVGDGACLFLRTDSFAASARLVEAIAKLPAVADHPPAVDIRANGVTIRLVTAAHDWFGTTERDVSVAQEISTLAGELGVRADPSGIQSLLIIPGAPSASEIMPFWRAVLGYEPRPDSAEEDLVDPHDRTPGFWFEQMDEPRPDGGGAIHVAVWVPHDQAEARLAAAIAAGGRLVRDHAPSWWTLADSAGNEADIATIRNRD